MEIQDYTSLVEALNAVDKLASNSVTKSISTIESQRDDVLMQILTYISGTITPLFRCEYFANKTLVDLMYQHVSLRIGRYQYENHDYVAQLFINGYRAYFASDGSYVESVKLDMVLLYDLITLWEKFKRDLRETIQRISQNFANTSKARVEEYNKIEQAFLDFEV